MEYTEPEWLTFEMRNTMGDEILQHHKEVGWSPHPRNLTIDVNTTDDSHGLPSPQKNQRDAEKIVRMAHRAQFFGRRQAFITENEEGGDLNYDHDRAAPWFQSVAPNLSTEEKSLKDKCNWPEPFPGGAPNEKYWDMRLERVSTNAKDQQGPDIEMYNVRVHFRYNKKSKLVAEDGITGKRGIMSYKPKADPADKTFPRYIGIQAVPSDDDDFDCRASRTEGINYYALVGAAAAAMYPGVGTAAAAALVAAYGGIGMKSPDL